MLSVSTGGSAAGLTTARLSASSIGNNISISTITTSSFTSACSSDGSGTAGSTTALRTASGGAVSVKSGARSCAGSGSVCTGSSAGASDSTGDGSLISSTTDAAGHSGSGTMATGSIRRANVAKSSSTKDGAGGSSATAIGSMVVETSGDADVVSSDAGCTISTTVSAAVPDGVSLMGNASTRVVGSSGIHSSSSAATAASSAGFSSGAAAPGASTASSRAACAWLSSIWSMRNSRYCSTSLSFCARWSVGSCNAVADRSVSASCSICSLVSSPMPQARMRMAIARSRPAAAATPCCGTGGAACGSSSSAALALAADSRRSVAASTFAMSAWRRRLAYSSRNQRPRAVALKASQMASYSASSGSVGGILDRARRFSGMVERSQRALRSPCSLERRNRPDAR